MLTKTDIDGREITSAHQRQHSLRRPAQHCRRLPRRQERRVAVVGIRHKTTSHRPAGMAGLRWAVGVVVLIFRHGGNLTHLPKGVKPLISKDLSTLCIRNALSAAPGGGGSAPLKASLSAAIKPIDFEKCAILDSGLVLG